MALSLTIASVPIALPMVMKVTLAVGAKEMAKEGGIVTHLTALEEIASMAPPLAEGAVGPARGAAPRRPPWTV